MKKCPDCSKEIDKYGIACEYCGRVSRMADQRESSGDKEGSNVRNSGSQSELGDRK